MSQRDGRITCTSSTGWIESTGVDRRGARGGGGGPLPFIVIREAFANEKGMRNRTTVARWALFFAKVGIAPALRGRTVSRSSILHQIEDKLCRTRLNQIGILCSNKTRQTRSVGSRPSRPAKSFFSTYQPTTARLQDARILRNLAAADRQKHCIPLHSYKPPLYVQRTTMCRAAFG